jgi:hypothetical protein
MKESKSDCNKSHLKGDEYLMASLEEEGKEAGNQTGDITKDES